MIMRARCRCCEPFYVEVFGLRPWATPTFPYTFVIVVRLVTTLPWLAMSSVRCGSVSNATMCPFQTRDEGRIAPPKWCDYFGGPVALNRAASCEPRVASPAL
jgi:hypothetical protein